MVHPRLLGILTVSALLLATPSALAKKKNKVRNGVFTSPLGDYTVVVPNLAFGTHMDQNFYEHGGALSFSSDLGEVYMIISQEAGPDVVAGFDDPNLAAAVFERYLEDYVLKDILRGAAPRSQIVYREPTSIGAKPAYFAVADMPEGAVVENMATHKRMDDTRGLLIFGEGRFIYVVGVGGGMNLFEAEKVPPPIEERAKGLRQRTDGFYGRVTFTKP